MKREMYANELILKFNSEMDGLIMICPEQLKDQWIHLKDSILSHLDGLDALSIIDIFGGIKESGQEYYKKIYFRFRTSPNRICQNIMKNVYGK